MSSDSLAPIEVSWLRTKLSLVDPNLLARAREHRAVLYWYLHLGATIVFVRLVDGDPVRWSCLRYENGAMAYLTTEAEIVESLTGGIALCEKDGARAGTIEDLMSVNECFPACVAEGSVVLEYV